ncbi:conserved exported hypothetical protein [Rhodococcus sp. RD6.2]|jgi:hypothetical protein|uniref:hypothetical protein n=1 Tax=Rhodococcus sp. RD6.2 TaxID=260936 RepID=UPI00063B1A48|nr:hypothetical protein [Rhodococcus sp. RD6.2]CRK52047.1 conserved exported hypothetical protein [Rhodococcus sp. RD6.2]
MRTVALRAAVAAAAVPSLLLLGSGAAAADQPAPDPVRPVVLLGQNQNPLAAFLACAPVGLIPLFGPNIILPICVA